MKPKDYSTEPAKGQFLVYQAEDGTHYDGLTPYDDAGHGTYWIRWQCKHLPAKGLLQSALGYGLQTSCWCQPHTGYSTPPE